MRFDKIHDNGSTIELQWSDLNSADDVVHTLRSKDRPTQDFERALQAFAAQVRKILGLKSDYELEIRGVTTKPEPENGDCAQSVIVSGVHEVEGSNRPFNISTPLLELDNFAKLQPLVDALCAEAELYAFRAKREQRDAFEAEQPSANGAAPEGEGDDAEYEEEESGELVEAE